MDLETLGKILTILIAGSGVVIGFIKWLKKFIKNIATEVITKSQSECLQKREDCMSNVAERLDVLEKTDIEMKSVLSDIKNLKDSDTNNKLQILTIKKDLESLTGLHETTQSMILNLEGKFESTISDIQTNFKDITTQLIDTIKSSRINHD